MLFQDAEDKGGGGEGDGKAPAVHAWYLVDADNKKLLLPRTMLFLGRDECDIIIEVSVSCHRAWASCPVLSLLSLPLPLFVLLAVSVLP